MARTRKLASTREVAAYVKKISSDDDRSVDELEDVIVDWTDYDGMWRLTRLTRVQMERFAAIPGAGRPPVISGRVDKYAAWGTPFPAVVVTGQGVVDGNHRISAALKRGDKWIAAWIPAWVDHAGRPTTPRSERCT